MTRRAVPSLVLALAAGCGYALSGTWEDDPDSWGRAFGSTRPDDVEVVRSWYWRSPHWTCEYEYFFHVRANDALRAQLFTENELVPVEGDPLADTFHAPPAWFLPGGAGGCDAWTFGHEPESRFRVLVDRTTGDLWLTDNQF